MNARSHRGRYTPPKRKRFEITDAGKQAIARLRAGVPTDLNIDTERFGIDEETCADVLLGLAGLSERRDAAVRGYLKALFYSGPNGGPMPLDIDPTFEVSELVCRCVLASLAYHADDDAIAEADPEDIAAMWGLDPAEVADALEALKAAGTIARNHRGPR